MYTMHYYTYLLLYEDSFYQTAVQADIVHYKIFDAINTLLWDILDKTYAG